MKLGISNISWPLAYLDAYSSFAFELGFEYVESAFSKVPNSKNVLAMQSIFYGLEAASFEMVDQVEIRLAEVVRLATSSKIQVLTIGAPSLRRGNKFFLLNLLKTACKNRDFDICIEPNARKFGGEYYFTVDEILEDLSPEYNIWTMIDTGNLFIENIDCLKTYERHQKYIKHIHFSTKDFSQIKDFGFYREFLQLLRKSSYSGLVTYELLNINHLEKHLTEYIAELSK